MERKINILAITNGNMGGVPFYRSIQPHKQLEEQYGDVFHIDYEASLNSGCYSRLPMYDIIHVLISGCRDKYNVSELFEYCRHNGTKVVIDIDDYWTVNNSKTDERIQNVKELLKNCDYITTTTELFAKELTPLNGNVRIFPNAINPEDERFKTVKTPCEKLRVGMIMGAQHLKDMKLLDGMIDKLPQDIRDKVVFVLCGFDTKAINIDPATKKRTLVKLPLQQTIWYEYEKILTGNYKGISPQYHDFLMKSFENMKYPDEVNEGYIRRWTKPMENYYSHYDEVDVLLAPLEDVVFNKVKSNLKMVECAFSHTAFIGSDYGPYTLDSKNMIEKGGEIDPEGNCILIDNNKAHKGWAKAIERLVKNPEMVSKLQDNLYRDYKDRYDLRNVTKERASFYEEITKQNITKTDE